MHDKLKEIAEILNIDYTECFDALYYIHLFFCQNTDKTIAWFTTKNPLLGELTPLELITVGRYNYLIKFIKSNI